MGETRPSVSVVGNATAAAAVYLRSAYRIHVNAAKANRCSLSINAGKLPGEAGLCAALNLALL